MALRGANVNGNAQLANFWFVYGGIEREFDNSLDNVLTVRASVGARLNELNVVDAVADIGVGEGVHGRPSSAASSRPVPASHGTGGPMK